MSSPVPTTEPAEPTSTESNESSDSSWHARLDKAKPGYRDLVQAVEADIRSGTLRPGQRLPTHRQLSTELGISRGTVARAYEEANRLGLLKIGIGQGTFVADAYGVRARQRQEDGLIELGLGFPIYELDPDPAQVLNDLARDPHRGDLLHYPAPGGDPAHRAAGAEWCGALGVECSEEDVLVTVGGQNAAHLWLQAVMKPGDTLLCGELTYRLVISAAESMGIQPHGVALDEEGLIPEALDEAARETRARGLYVMPTFQNPTTGVLSMERRRELLAIVAHHNMQVLEDDIHGLFHPKPRPTPLKAMAPDRVTYTASLSKVLAGGLRVGYAVPPPSRRAAFRSAVLSMLYSPPPLTAEIATRWIQDGTAAATLQRKVAEAEWRRTQVHKVLGPYVPEIRSNAYFAWMSLPDSWRAMRFAMEARRRQVSVMPAEPFYVGLDQAPEAIRISLGLVNRAQLNAGLEILEDLLKHPTSAQDFIV